MGRKVIELPKPLETTADEAVLVEDDFDQPYPNLGKDTTVHPMPGMATRRIISHVFDTQEDMWATWERLQAALRVGEHRTDYATLMHSLDDAESNCRDAHRLYCNIRLEQERVELDCKVLEAAGRQECVRQLEAEKESGQRKKQITEADIEARMLEVFPDEARRLAELKLKVRKTCEHAKELSAIWTSRARSLQTMVGKLR